MDILQDLLHWCTGWVDWNLLVDVTGGPNHLGNRCDANIIADPSNTMGQGSIITQAREHLASPRNMRYACSPRLEATMLLSLVWWTH